MSALLSATRRGLGEMGSGPSEAEVEGEAAAESECPMTGVLGMHSFQNGACIWCGEPDPDN